MEKDTEITKVSFRIYPEGDVIALFPDVAEGRYLCSLYQHFGQHGSGDYKDIVDSTRLAKPEEYKDLKEELEFNYGYNFQVIKRWSWNHNQRKG